MLMLLRQTQAAVRRGLGRLSRHLMLGIFISLAGAACLTPAGAWGVGLARIVRDCRNEAA